MHKELVDKRRWISEERFLHALNYCMLLPGPEAQQLAIYVGWLLHGTWGGIVAGAFFVIPSIFILLALAWIYAAYGNVLWVMAFFYGLKPVVVAIVAEAVIRIGRRALKNWVLISIAAGAFIAIYFYKISFPLIIVLAGVTGLVGSRFWRQKFYVIRSEAYTRTVDRQTLISDVQAEHHRPSLVWSLKVIAVCLSLWFAPVITVGLWRGWNDVIVQEAIFFSKVAMVTFGGAYAVLAYITQMAVYHYSWIEPDQMMDGLGLAETTPGPLIMVTQFVGFLAAYYHASGLAPAVAGTIGALLTTWVTFVPSFLWIFLGAPFIEQMRGNVKLSTTLSAITAAVVGIILNLALLFAEHVIFPEPGQFDRFAAALALVTFTGMLAFKWGMIPVILGGCAVGLAYRWLIA